MDRSRSKRNYYYDQEYGQETLGRTKPRYNNNNHQHHPNSNTHNRRGGGGGGGGRSSKLHDSSVMVTTSYRILCLDIKAGSVIGKSGSIIKAIRQHTGAWINVHELIPGDEERIIEISDTRRRDPDGRMPSFSPAQEALFLIHERILESDAGYSGTRYIGANGDEDDEYGPQGTGANWVVTRLVVSRMHVGSLLGKGGRIIEQMRRETKTRIRILPRDDTMPRCVSMSEEIVQVVGDVNAIKNALANISSRLRESQHRDRSHFQGRLQSPERFLSPDEEFSPRINNTQRQSSMDGAPFGSRMSSGLRNNNYGPRSSGYAIDAGAAPMGDNAQPFLGEDLVFRILCSVEKIDRVVGESDGILEMLRDEVGVDVRVTDPVAGSNELIIIISSDEGPDDELFPAQEALLHVQTRIVDIVPDKENFVTTSLLIPSNEIGCLEGKDGSFSEIRRLTGANIKILPRDQQPMFISGSDEIVQIVGEIKAARNALVEVTSRIRSYIYRDFFQKDMPPPPPPPPMSATGSGGSALVLEGPSPNNLIPAREIQTGYDRPTVTYQNLPAIATSQTSKDSQGFGNRTAKQNESERREDIPSAPPRLAVPLVTRSILEVVIPEQAVSKLVTRSRNKLAQISELSGAKVTLVDDGPDATERVIQISGPAEQAERAQSLLQGFILSIQEDP